MGLLAFLAFQNLAGHPLNNNDSDYFELGAAAWQTPSVLLKPHASLPGRLLASLVFVVVQPIFGTDPALYHILVIGLHLFASLLLAFTVFRLGFSLGIIA